MEIIDIFGLNIANVTMEDTVNFIEYNLIRKEGHKVIFTPNTDFVITAVNNPKFMKTLNSADLLIPDGMPLVWISKFLGTPLKEKVSGSTLFYKICEIAHKRNKIIYFMGGNEGIAKKAAENLSKQYSGIKIGGARFVQFGFEYDSKETKNILKDLNEIKPDILIIGLGAGQGERWIIKNRNNYPALISIQLGAALSFAGGLYVMPPEWIKNIGFAWLWQLIEQPKRQWRRPLRGLKIFKYAFQKKYLNKRFVFF